MMHTIFPEENLLMEHHHWGTAFQLCGRHGKGKGQKEKISQGWLPTRPPVGYKTVGETGHKTHIIDEQKAPLVKIFYLTHSLM